MNLSIANKFPFALIVVAGITAPLAAQGLTPFENGQVADASAVNANFQFVQSGVLAADSRANSAQAAADAAATTAANAQTTADTAQATADSAQATATSAEQTANAANSAIAPLTQLSSRLTFNGVNVGTDGVDSALFAESPQVIFARDRSPRFGQGGANAGFNFNSSDGVMIEGGINESGGFFANGNTSVIWSPGDGNRLLSIYDEDDFGLTNPTPDAFLNGSGAWTAQAYNTPSDRNFKTNIQPLASSLDRVMQISGYRYDYRDETRFAGEMQSGKPYDPTPIHNQIGFIAQDLQKTMPELVQYSEVVRGLTVNYDGMIPVLVEAMKEQQAQIELMRAELEALKQSK